MTQWPRRVAIAAAVVFLGLQFVPINRTNPAVDSSKTIYATQPVPANVQSVLERSCTDCHSDTTRWPWYSYVAPVSWMIANDVHNARREMNLSEWGTYPQKKKDKKLEEICDQLRDDEMPDGKYAFIHRSARVSPSERQAICQWTGAH